MRRHTAFTLIEVMVAVTLSAMMMAAAWGMFSQTQRVARRTQARMQLHATAKSIYESMRRDLTAMQQHCAMWLVSDPGSPAATPPVPRSVDLVFMTSVTDEAGYQMQGGWRDVPVSDLIWSRWRWEGDAQARLLTARSPSSRRWVVDTGLDGVPRNPTTGENLNFGTWFPSIPYVNFFPQPRRYTAGDALTGLDDNRWDLKTAGGAAIGAGRNLGDWGDLALRLKPAATNMSDCTIELVKAGRDAGGAVRTVTMDGSATASFCSHGIRMDGVASRLVTGAPAAITGFADEIDERPTLLRIAFTLTDVPTGMQVPFSFSFALPGPTPDL